jgi:signal transduction histidine kinase
MKQRNSSRLALSLCILALAFLSLGLASLLSRRNTQTFLDVAPLVLALVGFPTLGALIAARRPRNPIGWMFLAGSVLFGLVIAATEYADRALAADGGSEHGVVWAAWVTNWGWPLALGLLGGFTPLLFPNGRLPSSRWRPVLWTAVAALIMISAASALRPGVIEGYEPYQNPIGIESAAGLIDAILSVGLFTLGAVLFVGVASLFVRLRRAGGEERRQIRWFVYATAIVAVGVGVGALGATIRLNALDVGWLVGMVGLAAMPIAAAIGILKYRLYDIDVVINKTVVYGLLAAFVTAVYVGIVVGIGALVGARGNVLLSIVATAVIAVAFQPVRQRARHLANRLVYGERATPYEVLSEFSDRVGTSYADEDVLPRMARVIGEGVGATRADVWLRVGAELRRVASWPAQTLGSVLRVRDGRLPDIEGTDRSFAIREGPELLGALSVVKSRQEPLTPAEEKLLADLAGQAGLILRNVRLIEELRASRQRLVTAQDEERRRLERNIHDGAQQQLVALSVKMRLLKTLARKDPGKAGDLVDQLQAEAQDALNDLRDLARGIYPPLLADQGLAAALEAQARKAAVPVEVHPDGIGRYPQEAEATAYFCVLEALQNVAKYAGATSVVVRLSEEGGTLRFSVSDDGGGFDIATTPRGAGLQNMSDRVEAVGGRLEVSSTPGSGTTITGSIPVGG